jgi:hypothetical protein
MNAWLNEASQLEKHFQEAEKIAADARERLHTKPKRMSDKEVLLREETQVDAIHLRTLLKQAKQLLGNEKSTTLAALMYRIGWLSLKLEMRVHEIAVGTGTTRKKTNAKSRKKHSSKLASRNKSIVADVAKLHATGLKLDRVFVRVAPNYKKANGEPLTPDSIETIWKNSQRKTQRK